MGKLLFDEQPIVISRELAKLIGLNESIVLQQVHYWLEINRKANKNFREGKYWTYNSIRAWHEDNFEFWSYDTVKRTFAKLEKMGLLISANFNKDSRDKTKWYSINEDAVESLRKTIGAKCPNGEKPLNARVSPIGAKCPNPLVQNAPMQKGKMHQPLPETSTEINKTDIKSVSQSVLEDKKVKEKDKREEQTDRQTDELKKIKAILKDQVHIEDLKQIYDKGVVEEIELNIMEMYLQEKTVFANGTKPKSIMQDVIGRLNYGHIETLIIKFDEISASTKIGNTKRYLQAMIYNAPFETSSSIRNDIKSKGLI